MNDFLVLIFLGKFKTHNFLNLMLTSDQKLYLLKTCLTEAAAQEIKADTLRLILSMLNRTQERDLTLILKLKEEKNPFDR